MSHCHVFHTEIPDLSPSRSFALRRHPSSEWTVKVSQSKRSWHCSSLTFRKGIRQIMWISVETSAFYQRRKSHLSVIRQKSSLLCAFLSTLMGLWSHDQSVIWSACWELRVGGWLWLCMCACFSCCCLLMDPPSWSTSSISRVTNGLQ